MMGCVHCDAELVAPERSEYLSDKHARHIWLCPKCCACFSSVVSFSGETNTEPLTDGVIGKRRLGLIATAS
jgi:hypothetical protein